MSDSELAEFLSRMQEITLLRHGSDSVEESLKYLQAEVKEGAL